MFKTGGFASLPYGAQRELGHRWARRTDNARAVLSWSDRPEAYACILNAVSKPSVVKAKQEVEMGPGIRGYVDVRYLGPLQERYWRRRQDHSQICEGGHRNSATEIFGPPPPPSGPLCLRAAPGRWRPRLVYDWDHGRG